MRSKYEIYQLFKYGLKCYVPAYYYCSLEFLRQALFGSKILIEKKEVLPVDVPRWDEFKVKNFYDNIKHDERFKKYLPDLKE